MKYIEIYQQIKCRIQQDKYIEGSKLPSLRFLAKEFNCSIDTIKKAMALLVEEQLIYSKNRSGYYVLQKDMRLPANKESSFIDFGSTRSNVAAFPYSDFMLCLKKATENYKEEFFTYGSAQGLPELIHTLKIWFETKQLYVREENLFITTGIQQAIYILSRMIFPNNKKKILIELPSYHLILDLLEIEDLPFLTIERNEQGLDWSLLESLFKEGDIKFFYTTSRISSPLGLTYTEAEKKKLVQLAEQYNVYIIEDDYLGDFISDSSNLPLHFYDTSEHVIYLKSFSKIMFPGLRIGACILPTQLRDNFIKYRTILEVDSAMFSQAALNLYLKSGMFDLHVKNTLLIQKERDKAFIERTKNDPSLFQLDFFTTGKSFITLPHSISVAKFEKYLMKHQVNLEDIGRNLPNSYLCQEKTYTLELLQLSTKQIIKGVELIIDAAEYSKKPL